MLEMDERFNYFYLFILLFLEKKRDRIVYKQKEKVNFLKKEKLSNHNNLCVAQKLKKIK